MNQSSSSYKSYGMDKYPATLRLFKTQGHALLLFSVYVCVCTWDLCLSYFCNFCLISFFFFFHWVVDEWTFFVERFIRIRPTCDPWPLWKKMRRRLLAASRCCWLIALEKYKSFKTIIFHLLICFFLSTNQLTNLKYRKISRESRRRIRTWIFI